jgi:hypothetical protein
LARWSWPPGVGEPGIGGGGEGGGGGHCCWTGVSGRHASSLAASGSQGQSYTDDPGAAAQRAPAPWNQCPNESKFPTLAIVSENAWKSQLLEVVFAPSEIQENLCGPWAQEPRSEQYSPSQDCEVPSPASYHAVRFCFVRISRICMGGDSAAHCARQPVWVTWVVEWHQAKCWPLTLALLYVPVVQVIGGVLGGVGGGVGGTGGDGGTGELGGGPVNV